MYVANQLQECDLEFLRRHVQDDPLSIRPLKLEDPDLTSRVRGMLRRDDIFDDLVRPPVSSDQLNKRKLRVVKTSPFLYMLAVVDRAFPEFGIYDEKTIPYVADTLAKFWLQDDLFTLPYDRTKPQKSLRDMIESVHRRWRTSGTKQDAIMGYRHIGELALYQLGLFPDNIQRTRKITQMPVELVEEIGASCFLRASILSDTHDPMLERLADDDVFRATRHAINYAAREYIGLDPFVQMMHRQVGSFRTN